MSPWEAALEMAAKRCPYREMPEEKIEDPEEYESRWDESYCRDPWTVGFAFGFLGVPDGELYERDDRHFWQGFEAGESAQQAV